MGTLMATADGLQDLAYLLERSLSQDATVRAAAEKQLSDCLAYPDYAIGLVSLVASTSQKYGRARLPASIHLKTLISHRWRKFDADSSYVRPLPTFECGIIKKKIVDIFLKASPSIQAEIAEALVVMAASDFPAQWSFVLPSITVQLDAALAIAASLGAGVGAQELARINTFLRAASSLFLGFRQRQEKLFDQGDFDYCINGFANTLIKVIDCVIGLLHPTATCPVFECLHLGLQILHSFNSVHLHANFLGVIGRWFLGFYAIFDPSYSAADVDLLRAAVCNNLQLLQFTDTAELGLFVTAVKCLLMPVTPSTQFVLSGLKFLTTVAQGVHSQLLQSPDVLEDVYKNVIMLNMWPRDEDVALFNNNWIEYIRLESEVSDTDTARRAACELLRVLAINYREKVVALVSEHIQDLLRAGLVNNWKDKDAVIYLVIFFRNDLGCVPEWIHVVNSCSEYLIEPELLHVGLSEPILKATAIRFLKEFLHQMSTNLILRLLPHLVMLLKHDSFVVHSYAAHLFESLLKMNDAALVKSMDQSSLDVINNLYMKLFSYDTYENPYLIKCLGLILGRPSVDYNIAQGIVRELVSTIKKMCDRPKDSQFSKYMFEVLENLTQRFGYRVVNSDFWKMLERVLHEPILEFIPYACKLVGWFVNESVNPEDHKRILSLLLTSAAWHRPSCVAACVYMLRMLIPKVAQLSGICPILYKFDELLKLSPYEDTGVYILNLIVEEVDCLVIEPHLHAIWNSLFSRLWILRSDKRVARKCASSIIHYLSTFIVRFGNCALENLIASTNWEERFTEFMKLYWNQNFKLMKDSRMIMMVTTASIILLRENSLLHAELGMWIGLLDWCLEQIMRTDVHYAGLSNDRLLKDKEPKSFFGASCHILSTRFPGRFSFIINALHQSHRDYLCQLCLDQNISTA